MGLWKLGKGISPWFPLLVAAGDPDFKEELATKEHGKQKTACFFCLEMVAVLLNKASFLFLVVSFERGTFMLFAPTWMILGWFVISGGVYVPTFKGKAIARWC